jgi:hypothetical protein
MCRGMLEVILCFLRRLTSSPSSSTRFLSRNIRNIIWPIARSLCKYIKGIELWSAAVTVSEAGGWEYDLLLPWEPLPTANIDGEAPTAI